MDSWWRFVHCTILFGISFLLGSCYSEKAPYPTFAKDATLAPPVATYDYIIIGGGTSGCALAATLSGSTNVLLLERGNLPYTNPSVSNQNGFAVTLANISPTSPAQTFISTDGVINHRARILGGGSAINAGFYTRASSDYVKRAGWDENLVKESYEWVERKVAFEPVVMQWQAAVRDGLLEVGVVPDNGFTYEHIYGTKVGGSIFDQQGNRHTAADLLEYADPKNISLYLNAVAHRILFTIDGGARPKAHGVVFRDGKGKKHIAYLNKGSLMNEVILTAGTLGSPQLLMLSGVGPAEHLMTHNIKVVLDQPMVGQGLSDNPMNILIIPTPRPVEQALIQVVGITRFGSYIEAASAHIYLGWIHKLAAKLGQSANETDQPNKLPFKQETLKAILGHGLNLDPTGLNVGIILEKIIGPLSSGHLKLHTTNPNDNPIVTFNYFQDPRDLQRCVDGMETILKIVESKALSKFRDPLLPVQALIDLMVTLPVNLRPRHLSATFSLEQYCRDTVMTIWHYHGGCQVDRVVDHVYKVIGVDALRVIDSSTLINSPGTNPQATVMMLGRYMGKKILDNRFPHGKK